MLSLGIIGMSEENGHPYSWSAIFNGYNPEKMRDCPFPAIPKYLSAQTFPADAIADAKVTHIWTQDIELSKHIAAASYISHVCTDLREMIGKVDAVLLARDDAEHHFEQAEPFLKAGLPVFIDKPFAYTTAVAKKILNAQVKEDQVFTCSSLRFAKEFQLSAELLDTVGEIKLLEGNVPKSWKKYAIHVIEPSLGLLPARGGVKSVEITGDDEISIVNVRWENAQALYKSFGSVSSNISIRLYGTKGMRELIFEDTFFAFKKSLMYFVDRIHGKVPNLDIGETLEIVSIVEKGNRK